MFCFKRGNIGKPRIHDHSPRRSVSARHSTGLSTSPDHTCAALRHIVVVFRDVCGWLCCIISK